MPVAVTLARRGLAAPPVAREFLEAREEYPASSFEGIDERDFPNGLPLEMIVRVFRTYKGDIEKGIAGSVRVRNPKNGLQSDPFYFTAKEFTIDSLRIPRQVATTTADGGTRQVDLFADLVDAGRLEVILQCLEPAQYYGVAQADFYMLAGNGSFAWNYCKSCLGIWFSMLLVAASLEAFAGYCLGCAMFSGLMRLGVIPESVCLECADITSRLNRNAA